MNSNLPEKVPISDDPEGQLGTVLATIDSTQSSLSTLQSHESQLREFISRSSHGQPMQSDLSSLQNAVQAPAHFRTWFQSAIDNQTLDIPSLMLYAISDEESAVLLSSLNPNLGQRQSLNKVREELRTMYTINDSMLE